MYLHIDPTQYLATGPIVFLNPVWNNTRHMKDFPLPSVDVFKQMAQTCPHQNHVWKVLIYVIPLLSSIIILIITVFYIIRTE